MLKSRTLSLKSKLVRMQLFLVVPILTLAFLAFVVNDALLVKSSIESQFQSTAKILSRNLVPAVSFMDKEEATKILSSLQDESSIVAAYVFTGEGEPFASYTRSNNDSSLLESSEVCDKTQFLSDRFIFFHSLDREGSGVLCLEADLNVFFSEYKSYIGIVAVVFFMSILLAFTLAHWTQRSLSRPIIDFARMTRKISTSGDYSLRMNEDKEVDKIDEVKTLTREFNLMLDQIQRRDIRINEEKEVAMKANQAKSLFLANISHELRTPMHGVLSFAHFGQTKIENASKEKLKSYFDEIHESAARLMLLLNDLLDLSKLEAGKVSYSMETDNLLKAIQVVQAEMTAFAEGKGLKIKVESKSNEFSDEFIATFDRTKMMQVLRNILSNAIKFSNEGTTIKILLKELNGKIRCEFINKGVGIPADELDKVFDKFMQSSKTQTGAGGTGLGLAICREIVVQHGGTIWAESEINKETRFIFEIPATNRQQMSAKSV